MKRRPHSAAAWFVTTGGLAALMLALGGCGSGGGTHRAAPPTLTAPATTPKTSPIRSVPTSPPSPTGPVTTTAAPSSPTAAPSAPGRYAFPVQPSRHVSFARVHHDYPATDIFAACGDSFRAPTSGGVLAVSRVDGWDPKVNAGATRGGLSVTLLGVDGVRYYGSHLSSVTGGLRVGAEVVSGQPLGVVGHTGDARSVPCHVHFGISPDCAGSTDWWNRRGVLYPWPYLDSWRAGGQLSPTTAIVAWRSRHGCPSRPSVDP
jgi:hypothetical protein